MGVIHGGLREIHTVGVGTREWIVLPATCPALAEHGVVLAGRSQVRGEFRFVRPNPDVGQALACVSGEGRVRIDGAWQPCGAGTAYVTPAGVPHAYEAVRGKSWEVAWAMFADLPRSPLRGLASPRLAPCDASALRAAVTGLYREVIGRAELAVMRPWASLIYLHAARMASPGETPSRLGELWEAVDADLARAWTVPRLAELAGVSGEHLRRLCVTQHGCSPIRHVTRMRLHRAAAMLTTTPWPVGEVAAAVGYGNAFAFSTAFKRVFGRTPSAYRGAG